MKIKSYINKILIILIIILTGQLQFGCSENGISASDFNLFTTSDDIKLGSQLDAQITGNSQEYPVLNNQTATSYLQNILNEIVKSPEIRYKSVFDYKIKIISNDSVVNAFALPGGYLYVYTGLLKFIDNEATIAAIIAHEAAHADRRHASTRMTKQYGISFLLQVILGDNPNEIEKIGANLFSNLKLLKNSRDDEYEADKYSFLYLRSTVWYPGGGTYFFDKIKSNESANFLTTLLSTHPMSQDRIDALKKFIADNNIPSATEANLFTQRYANFVKTLP